MDRKKILEEGMLERYLLGSLTEQEEALLETKLEQDHELKSEFEILELEFEQIGLENAIEPEAHVKEKLKVRLNETEGSGQSGFASKTIPNRSRSSRFMVAASIAALFALGSLWLYVQWQNSLDEFRTLQNQTVELQERLNNLEQKYDATEARFSSISTPGVIPLYLVGNDISPNSSLIAYINHNDKTVIVNTLGLQPLDKDHTYQLWADVDGEMINMGVLPQPEEYLPVRYIDKAESLNITIEPVGGSEHPTVEYLISNIYL